MKYRIILAAIVISALMNVLVLRRYGWIEFGNPWLASWSNAAIEATVFAMAIAVFIAAYKSDLKRHCGWQFPDFWFLARTLLVLTALEIAVSNGLFSSTGRDYFYADGAFGSPPGSVLVGCRKLPELAPGAAPTPPPKHDPQAGGSNCDQPYKYSPHFLISLVVKKSGNERQLTVPVWIGLGWTFVFFAARNTAMLLVRVPPMNIGERMSFSLARRQAIATGQQAAIAGLIALSIDFGLDPIAHASSWWRWGDRSSPGGGGSMQTFLGVPITNYAAWLIFVLVISFAYFVLRAVLVHLRSDEGGRFTEELPSPEKKHAQTRSEQLVVAIAGIIPLALGIWWRRLRIGLLNSLMLLGPGALAFWVLTWVKYRIYAADDRGPASVVVASAVLLSVAFWLLWTRFPFQHAEPLGAKAAACLTFPAILHFLFLVVLLTLPEQPPTGQAASAVGTPADLAFVILLSSFAGVVVFAWPYLDDLMQYDGEKLARRIRAEWRNLLK